MGKLKSYQEQVQKALSKGIDKAEQKHKRLVTRPFDFAEKVEKEAKSYSVKSVRQAHNHYAKSVYSSLRAINERANSFASDLISRIEKEEGQKQAKQTAATGTQKPVAKKAAARKTTASAKKSEAGTQAASSAASA